jgi:hypothetical protein
MTIRFVEDIYADFLFDCYIANQHLTDEDWHYYGREEHHIEVPNRDGGELTPLNSQPLTTYQHWMAGVLQSEVLGKCCFAMVPRDVLPSMFEMLRWKWASHLGKQQQPPHPSGENHPRYGKKHTKESRRKMSASRKGKPGTPHTDETRRKLSEGRKGFVFSAETIEKMKASNGPRNRTNPPNARYHEITFETGKTLVIHNLSKWCRENGYSESSLRKVKNGTREKSRDIAKVRETEPPAS